MAERRERGIVLTVVAILFAVLAVSNASKALQYLVNPSHLLGAVLAAYAYGLWTLAPERDRQPT